MRNRNIDISKELHLCRYNNGVKLIRPEDASFKKNTVNDVFKLPMNVYFVDRNGTILNLNEHTVEYCGFASAKSAIGNTVALVAKTETVNFEKQHDQLVIKNKKLIIKQEYFFSLNDKDLSAITFKQPWYSDENKIIGIFGCSVILNNSDNLSHAFSYILQSKLFSFTDDNQLCPTLLGYEVDSVHLSPQLMQCAKLLIRGKTAKAIAAELNLSRRTVEYYLENIKVKLNVSNKSELIEKLINYGF